MDTVVADPWDRFKRAYARLEGVAAPRLERALRSRALIAPAAAGLSAAWRAQARVARALDAGRSALGLATRAEHHALRDAVARLRARVEAVELERAVARAEEPS